MLAAYVYSCLPASGGQPVGPIFNGLAEKDPLPLKTGLIVCPETSVNNYQRALRNNAEERRSHAHFLIPACDMFFHPPLTTFIFSREKRLHLPYVRLSAFFSAALIERIFANFYTVTS